MPEVDRRHTLNCGSPLQPSNRFRFELEIHCRLPAGERKFIKAKARPALLALGFRAHRFDLNALQELPVQLHLHLPLGAGGGGQTKPQGLRRVSSRNALILHDQTVTRPACCSLAYRPFSENSEEGERHHPCHSHPPDALEHPETALIRHVLVEFEIADFLCAQISPCLPFACLA